MLEGEEQSRLSRLRVAFTSFEYFAELNTKKKGREEAKEKEKEKEEEKEKEKKGTGRKGKVKMAREKRRRMEKIYDRNSFITASSLFLAKLTR